MDRPVPLHPSLYALRRRFREDGLRGAARYAARRLRAQVYDRERHLVLEKNLQQIAVPVRQGAVRVETVERRHLPALSALNRERGDLTGDVRFAGDLAAGYAGYVAFKDEELIGCYWWTDGSMPPHHQLRTIALGIELVPGHVYGTDFYVAERHRAGGTATDFLFQIETALSERGFERLWGTVEVGNRTARWTYAARGYEERWAVEGTRIMRRWRNRIAPIKGERAVPA